MRAAWRRCTSGACSGRSASRARSPSSACTRSSRRTPSSSRCSSTRRASRRASATRTSSPTLDVVATEGELFLVMEYVAGRVARAPRSRGAPSAASRVPLPHRRAAIVASVLARAARRARGDATSAASRSASCTATSRRRTSSSAADGVARVLDFGVAKAAGRCRRRARGSSRASSRTWRPSRSPGRPTHPERGHLRRLRCASGRP